MFFDAGANLVVGSMGWVDKGALWTFDLASRKEKRIAIDDAKSLSLRAGANGLFRVIHHGSPDPTISIRAVATPEVELAGVKIAPHGASFTGDVALWQHVEPAAIVGQKLFLIDALQRQIIDLDLTWYWGGNYDLGYQGLTDCITIGAKYVIVSVQRSGELVVIDLHRNARTGTIPLAGRGGNPTLTMRTQADFLASDYDTLYRVDVETLKAVTCHRLQEAGPEYTRCFIGEYDLGWRACVVARPFSGDVVRLDPETFAMKGRAAVDGQPLQVCMISENLVVTRDWKTGNVAVSQF